MPLDGSPKKFGEDVSNGLQIISRATLKRHNAPDIQKILSGLEVVLREIRATPVPSGDYEALKMKGVKMQRINGAMLVIRTYQKEQKRLIRDTVKKPPLSRR